MQQAQQDLLNREKWTMDTEDPNTYVNIPNTQKDLSDASHCIHKCGGSLVTNQS